jgi:hypothetical protein|tara:strand:- start:1080 stop:1262 length:183 start_codon:yes stop_codon:yes gene_type:complete
MLIFFTEYEKDGEIRNGPFIMCNSVEEAAEQAEYCNITIVGSLVESIPQKMVVMEKRNIH